MGSNMPAVRNAAAVLRLLASNSRPIPASAVARHVGMPRSSTYQLLQVLIDEGLVSHIPETHNYSLGVAAFELGSAYLRKSPLEHLAQPILARLVAQTAQAAQLGILHGREVLYLLKEQPPTPTTLVTGVGVRMPAHLTASGRSMLALLPRQQLLALFPRRESFVDRTGVGPTNLRELRAVLAGERERGWAVEEGAVSEGVTSIAAAAHELSGRPAASIGISFRAESVRPEDYPQLAAYVAGAASELSTRLR
ncbi:IclR family transcriptional regulator [Spelaeicoccus albus]|uniref:DNA-binding IclR family transcriptional regulator n=1 Tax=Spelaeicoccus albus TaxID=1280376 RepID=A0A7Z0D535_9MICO|nr:IclR family transcriptional regulator [Spelaeicoccus albus]NYI69059.1 DNA-binding IclR family transcriptional regulator [Spelaeicoccus albus]